MVHQRRACGVRTGVRDGVALCLQVGVAVGGEALDGVACAIPNQTSIGKHLSQSHILVILPHFRGKQFLKRVALYHKR